MCMYICEHCVYIRMYTLFDKRYITHIQDVHLTLQCTHTHTHTNT